MIQRLGFCKVGRSGESWLGLLLIFFQLSWGWRVEVVKEDLGIIFCQGPLSIFLYLWWQTSV